MGDSACMPHVRHVAQLGPVLHSPAVGQACVALQAEQISSQLKRLKPWQLQLLAKGALFVQRVMNMTQQQKLMALAVIVLLFALLLRWLGWL